MEFMRFMRYVLPGLVVIAEIVIAVFFSSHLDAGIKCALKKSFLFETIIRPDGVSSFIGIAISAFLVSGGIGYIFSAIYYFVRNLRDCFFDHKPAIISLVKEGHLTLNSIAPESGEVEKVYSIKNYGELSDMSRRQAWEVFHVLWYRVLNIDKSLSENLSVVNRQIDITHGQGAIAWGSIIALVVWFLLSLGASDSIGIFLVNNWIVIVSWLIFIILLNSSQGETRKTVENNMNNAIVTSVSRGSGQAYSIYFFNSVKTWSGCCGRIKKNFHKIKC